MPDSEQECPGAGRCGSGQDSRSSQHANCLSGLQRKAKAMRKSSMCWALVVFGAVGVMGSWTLRAADYYVDAGNASASDSNAGTASAPWKTITKANQMLAAGDTVYIKRSTYSQSISPSRSGTATDRITYRNFGSDVVTITGAIEAIVLNGKSYITVQGLTFSQVNMFLDIASSSRNIIANCNFIGKVGTWTGYWSGARIRVNSQYNWIHDCVFGNFGTYTTDDVGSVMDIGDEESKTDHSDYNLLENNTMYHGGHHVLGVNSRYNVIRNNYFHNENWYNGYGDRCLSLNGYDEGSGWNLVEGNRIGPGGQPPDNAESSGIGMATKSNIVRFNCFYRATGPGVMMGTTSAYYTGPAYNRLYHNTFYQNGQSTNPESGAEVLAGIGIANYGSPYSLIGNAIKNNAFYSNPVSIATYRVNLSDQIIQGNFQQTGDPLFVDGTIPNLTNASLPNFQLRTNSPCIDRGVALTTITSATGSGRTVQLADATYFMDGWGVVQGDLIQLLGTTQRARILSVNYATRSITVDANLTWTQNQGVTMAYEGTAPDLGAYEYGSGVASTNQAPVVTLAASQTIGFPTNTASLRGSAADANGDRLSFSWQQMSGPAAATVSNPNGSNTVVTVTVRGTYLFSLTVSDGMSASYAETSLTFTPDPSALSFEAENGSLTPPFVAQNGYIIQNSLTGATDGGRAAYVFTVLQDGSYVVTGFVNAPDEGANSLFVNIDAEPVDPAMIWDIPVSAGFESRAASWRGTGALLAPKVFILVAGTHTLVVRGREAGVQLDRLEITKTGPSVNRALEFRGVRRLPGGAVQLTLTGELGRTNVIEVSADLANWTALTNLVNATGTVQWTDTLSAGTNRRFYRAVVL
jgi:hypothetical protein